MNEFIFNRARSALGKGTVYRLGKGGRMRFGDVPHDENRGCDCSGFVSFCLGLDRYQPRNPLYKKFNGGWVCTSSMVHDASRPQSEYGFLEKVDVPDAGDIVVYGDYRVNGVKKQGHCGIVTDVPIIWDGTPQDWADLRVIHCSASRAARLAGSAIQETPGTLFMKRGIFARFYVPAEGAVVV